MWKSLQNNFLIVIALSNIYACKEEKKTIEVPYPPISEVFEAYYQDGLKMNPIQATFMGDTRYNDTLPNFLSETFRSKSKQFYTDYKTKLSHYPDSLLTESERLSKAIMQWDCDVNLEGLTFEEYTPIDQMWSLNLMIGQLASGNSAQPFATVQDYQNWLARLNDYLDWLNMTEVQMRKGMQTGNVLPKSLIKKVLPQLKSMTEPELEDHLFYSPIKNIPETFSENDKTDLTAAYRAIITEKIIPAYQKLYDFMASEYLESGRESSGIANTPNGDAYYRHQIKKYTTTNMTADEIHQLGLNEVARIRSEMEKTKNQVGYTGSLKSFFDHIRNKSELMPFTDPQQVIENFNKIHQKMKPQIEKLFDLKPKTAFEVRRTEAFREASASAEYNPGSIDGSRPGIFYVPIPDVKKYNTYSDEDLFLHEAIPGHHFQISLQQENKDLPNFRKVLMYSSFTEGWALYSESLGKELGLYTDPYQYFGMLGAEIHRAIRLVVDTGLHSKNWTREQAIQYSLDNEAVSEAGITSEIERYMANPGQALSYKIGQLKIHELRKKAEMNLGEAFDIREFHNQILETGSLPLALLEEKITEWITQTE